MCAWVRLAALMAVLALAGCAGTTVAYPTTTGAHLAGEPLLRTVPRQRVVIQCQQDFIRAELTRMIMALGHVVVERTELHQLLGEQVITLQYGADEEALRLGRMVGATQVIFVTVDGEYVGAPSVALRSVDVQSGLVRWTGTASYPDQIQDQHNGFLTLTWLAFLRALCPTERGAVWREHAEQINLSCQYPR